VKKTDVKEKNEVRTIRTRCYCEEYDKCGEDGDTKTDK
jgi:hypothetical protein